MKYLIIYICCLICVASETKVNGRNLSITFGAPGSREVHLKRDTITENAKLLRVVSKDYEFQQMPGKIPFGRIITRIVVTDQYTNGNGGKASLIAGGPGEIYARLHLKSQRGHGFNFIIDVFGQ